MATPFIMAYVLDVISKATPGNSVGGSAWIFLYVSVPVGALILTIVAITHIIWIIKKFTLLSSL